MDENDRHTNISDYLAAHLTDPLHTSFTSTNVRKPWPHPRLSNS